MPNWIDTGSKLVGHKYSSIKWDYIPFYAKNHGYKHCLINFESDNKNIFPVKRYLIADSVKTAQDNKIIGKFSYNCMHREITYNLADTLVLSTPIVLYNSLLYPGEIPSKYCNLDSVGETCIVRIPNL